VRKLPVTLLLILLATGLAAQDDCRAVVNYRPGSAWTYQWYGANEKVTYQTIHRVVDYDAGDQRSNLELLILNAFQDTVYRGQYAVRCKPEGLYQDLLAKLTPDMLSSLEGLALRAEDQGWLLPRGAHPGDTIPQSYSRITGYDQNVLVLELSLAVGPVVILAQEDLSTPAGGFSCVAMTYELLITQIVQKSFRLRDWFSPGVGVIRREVFDRRGNFFGYCELINYKKA